MENFRTEWESLQGEGWAAFSPMALAHSAGPGHSRPESVSGEGVSEANLGSSILTPHALQHLYLLKEKLGFQEIIPSCPIRAGQSWDLHEPDFS